MLPKGLQTTFPRRNPMQCCLNNIWSLFDYFYIGPFNILIINSCCKCRTNIAQMSSTLHKKNPRPTLNKNTRLYGQRNNVNSNKKSAEDSDKIIFNKCVPTKNHALYILALYHTTNIVLIQGNKKQM